MTAAAAPCERPPPGSDQPPAVLDRPAAVPEIHRLAMRETAVIAVDVAPTRSGRGRRGDRGGRGGDARAGVDLAGRRSRATSRSSRGSAPRSGSRSCGRRRTSGACSRAAARRTRGVDRPHRPVRHARALVRPDAPLARRARPPARRSDVGGLLERPRRGAGPGDLAHGDLRADRASPRGRTATGREASRVAQTGAAIARRRRRRPRGRAGGRSPA